MAFIRSLRTSLRVLILLAALLATATWAFAQGHTPGGGGGGGHTPGGGGGGEEETLGNNLSVPVVFAEGVGITGLPVATDTGLRPRPTETNPTLPYFDPSTVVIKENVTYYPQMTESTWRAGWVAGLPGGESAFINWGDNLLARTWSTRSVIRVETVLYQNAATALTAYRMTSLFGAQRDEVWGTSGEAFDSTYRTVYAVTPRLIIERITGPGGDVVPGLPRFEGSVAAAFEDDGPGGYAAEVNGSGSIVYGFNWTLPQWDMPVEQKAGWWRLTFTLDPIARYTLPAEEEGGSAQSMQVTRNVMLTGLDPADLGDEFTYRPVLVSPTTSILEIQVTASGGGGGGGGGGGNGGGGGEPEEPVDPNDVDSDGLPDAWETLYGISIDADTATADPDGDGLTNEEEYLAGSHPKSLCSRYFAEGVASGFFTTRLSILNASRSASANVLVRFLTASGTTISRNLTLSPLGVTSIDAATVPGLENTAFATIVEADQPLAVDRSTSWDASGYGSHASEGAAQASKTWYMAEGATHSGFKLFYLIGNPGGTAADVEITYLRPAPLPPIVKTYTVAAHSRLDVWVNTEDAELAAADVSAIVSASVPVVVERSMYLDTGGLVFGAGTSTAAVPEPALQWFLAEGAVSTYFDTFIEILNPTATDAAVRVTYLLPSGTPVEALQVVPAMSRSGIWVDQNQQLPASTSISAIVESTNGVPIVVERTMWWPGPTSATWLEGHANAGATVAGARWAVMGPGEGALVSNYLLIQNTSTTPGSVEVTVAPEGGTPLTVTVPIAARSRIDVPIDEVTFPGLAGRRFGVMVDSLGSQPAEIVIELSTYGDSGSTVWAAGSNRAGTRIQ